MINIFVGNLGVEITLAQLRDLFAPFGAVESVTIVNNRDTGQGRGFAFVEMTQASEAESAITALNGKVMDGRELRVNEARSKATDDPNQPPSGTRDHRRHRV